MSVTDDPFYPLRVRLARSEASGCRRTVGTIACDHLRALLNRSDRLAESEARIRELESRIAKLEKELASAVAELTGEYECDRQPPKGDPG